MAWKENYFQVPLSHVLEGIFEPSSWSWLWTSYPPAFLISQMVGLQVWVTKWGLNSVFINSVEVEGARPQRGCFPPQGWEVVGPPGSMSGRCDSQPGGGATEQTAATQIGLSSRENGTRETAKGSRGGAQSGLPGGWCGGFARPWAPLPDCVSQAGGEWDRRLARRQDASSWRDRQGVGSPGEVSLETRGRDTGDPVRWHRPP